MKHIAFLLVCLHLALLSSWAQADCASISPYPSGRQWVYQWYGSNEKPSYTTYRSVQAEVSPGVYRLETLILNAFADTIYRGSYEVRCTPEGLYQDLLAKLTPDMLASLAGLRVETEEEGWRLPHGMRAGDEIPQSYAHLKGYDGLTKVVELDLAIGPVQILEQEDLSTPAGGFPCVAMAYELWVTTIIRKRFRLRDWFAPGVGIIRREVFDKRGRFYGYCELVGVN